MADEHNIFSKQGSDMSTNAGHSKTYVDRIEVGAPNGRLGIVKFHVMVKQARRDRRCISKYLTEASPRRWQQVIWCLNSGYISSSLRTFHAQTPLESPTSKPREQYQAAFEIAFKNRLDMEAFFASEAYVAAVKDRAKYVARSVHSQSGSVHLCL